MKRDLAEQLRKRPEAVATALNLALKEQKVRRAPVERVLEIEYLNRPKVRVLYAAFLLRSRLCFSDKSQSASLTKAIDHLRRSRIINPYRLAFGDDCQLTILQESCKVF